MTKWQELYEELKVWTATTKIGYDFEGEYWNKVMKHANKLTKYSQIDRLLAVEQIMLDKFRM